MERREDNLRVGMVLVMLITFGQSFQPENESDFIDEKDKITFSSNFEDFPTDLQTFLKRFNISYFPKFESFHGEDINMNKEDTHMNKEDSNMNKFPKKYFAPESASQIDVRGQQSPSFKGSLDSQSYKFKVVLPPYIPRPIIGFSLSSYPGSRETMKSMKTPESKLILRTPRYNIFPRFKDTKYNEHGMFKMDRFPNLVMREDEQFTQPYKKCYIKETREKLSPTISPTFGDSDKIHHIQKLPYSMNLPTRYFKNFIF
jgi:hypothetical protein